MNSAFKKFDLTGKTAIVTGGGAGLGYFMTRGLMRSGAKVMMVARREDVLAKAADQLRQESDAGEIIYYRADLGKRKDVAALVDHANKSMGGADIVVCNAVLSHLQRLEEIQDEALEEMFQVNVAANIALARSFVPNMRKNKWGRVILVSSVNSILGMAEEGTGSYSACKGGLNAFAKTAAAETGHDGITFNSLLLGMYMTELMDNLIEDIEREKGAEASKEFVDSSAASIALGRMGKSEEVEGVIQFLASDAGSYCTGADLVLDGGLSIMMKPNQPPADPVYPNL